MLAERNEDQPTEAEAKPQQSSLAEKLQQDVEELTAEIELLREALTDCEISNVQRRIVTTRKGRPSIQKFNGRITKVLHG